MHIPVVAIPKHWAGEGGWGLATGPDVWEGVWGAGFQDRKQPYLQRG